MREILIFAFCAVGCGTNYGTSLEGPTACGAISCSSGEVCVVFGGGADVGAADGGVVQAGTCRSTILGREGPRCVIRDCLGTQCQNTCVNDFCSTGAFGSIVARTVTCASQ